MAITYSDRLIDAGHYDITPEQEREIEARKECARRCIDPDEICADGGVLAWMVVDQELGSTRGDRGWALSHNQCQNVVAIVRPPILPSPTARWSVATRIFEQCHKRLMPLSPN